MESFVKHHGFLTYTWFLLNFWKPAKQTPFLQNQIAGTMCFIKQDSSSMRKALILDLESHPRCTSTGQWHACFWELVNKVDITQITKTCLCLALL